MIDNFCYNPGCRLFVRYVEHNCTGIELASFEMLKLSELFKLAQSANPTFQKHYMPRMALTFKPPNQHEIRRVFVCADCAEVPGYRNAAITYAYPDLTDDLDTE